MSRDFMVIGLIALGAIVAVSISPVAALIGMAVVCAIFFVSLIVSESGGDRPRRPV